MRNIRQTKRKKDVSKEKEVRKNNLLQVEELRKARRKRNVGRRNREKKEQHVAS